MGSVCGHVMGTGFTPSAVISTRCAPYLQDTIYTLNMQKQRQQQHQLDTLYLRKTPPR